MEKKSELTAADLALYLGCECKTLRGFGVIDAVSRERIQVKTDSGAMIFPPDDVWPILRPLSDMSTDERQEFNDFVFNGNAAQREALRTKHLLSHGFDLFGWIPAGLAIDKTKL